MPQFKAPKFAVMASMATVTLLGIGVTRPAQAAMTWTFDFTDTAVTWTVPVTGRYDITAYGAQGGSGGTGFIGGLGAVIGGSLPLAQGESLTILVGGMGDRGSIVGVGTGTDAGFALGGGGGGGGGGSFVALGTQALVVAGGGGGAGSGGFGSPQLNGRPGGTVTYDPRYSGLGGGGVTRANGGWGGGTCTNGGGFNGASLCMGGAGNPRVLSPGSDTGGFGTAGGDGGGSGGGSGNPGTTSYGGGGGGGFDGIGGGIVLANGRTNGASGFLSPADPPLYLGFGAGGEAGPGDGAGGFGGGGGGFFGGGGGGGYSGGAGGGYYAGGGGGGSYLASWATEFVALPGENIGYGQVDISWISRNAVPEPSTWALMLIGFAGLGYAGYQRARVA